MSNGSAVIEETGPLYSGPAAGHGAGWVVARPGMFERLDAAARVTLVSAPAGSGKTVLLRSWLRAANLGDRAAWVSAGHDERDPGRFWPCVAGALRRTAHGAALVQPLTAAPDLDGLAATERLLADLAPLADRLWLVIDDVHELDPDTLRQLELLIMRTPSRLRFVLAARHDVRLGLHRLRLEGELTEIREPDLRFTAGEAGELFAAAGADLPESAVALLHKRTEGWATGLRLAALSVAGHPDPEGFAAGFSGSERTVAEYLLAEVLDRQDERVRRLLLRTAILDRVNGELADLLTGDVGGERLLQDLEQAGAFVVSLDSPRSWFRYHRLFADLLRLELRRAAPAEVDGLHLAASGWFASHGFGVEAIRHAQSAGDWERAARLLGDHWPGLLLDGRAAVTRELLAAFPPGVRAADAELATVAGAYELSHGSLEEAGRYLGLAARGVASLPGTRQRQARLRLGIAGLLLARQRADPAAEAEAALALRTEWQQAGAQEAASLGLGKELRALTLTGLGSTEYWTARFAEVESRLERGVTLAREIGRPFLECTGLAHLAAVQGFRSHRQAAEHARQALRLAERHGWTGEYSVGVAATVLACLLTWEGRFAEAEPFIQGAERAVRADAQPVPGIWVCLHRALLELGRGRDAAALAAFRGLDRVVGILAAPSPLVTISRAFQVLVQVLAGEAGRAEQIVAGLGEQERAYGEIRIAVASLRLAGGDPRAALAALAPVTGGSVPLIWPVWLVEAFLLEAIAQDVLGDPAAAGRALERALDEAEPNGVLLPFLLHPAPGLIERHSRAYRFTGRPTSHAALLAEIRSRLAGNQPAPPSAEPELVAEPLSDSELRVLRYLPTNLTAPEIARDLSVSHNTIKTHIRNVYAKLGTSRRAEAVARGRALGLLAQSARGALAPSARGALARSARGALARSPFPGDA